MKTIKLTVATILLLLSVFLPAIADDALPNSGTYFIVSRSSGEALQPVGASLGQNVELFPFDKGGLQKWTLTRLIDSKTRKPTNRYNIRLAGEIPGLEMQPHDVADRTAVLLETKSVFVLQPKGDGMLLKSVKRNGDAMFVYPVANMNAEARFGPSDDSAKFLWDLQPAN
jgi:hypothetical protein